MSMAEELYEATRAFIEKLRAGPFRADDVQVYVGYDLFTDAEHDSGPGVAEFSEVSFKTGGAPPNMERRQILDVGFAKIIPHEDIEDYTAIFINPGGFRDDFPYLVNPIHIDWMHFGRAESDEKRCRTCGDVTHEYVETIEGYVYCSMVCRYRDND